MVGTATDQDSDYSSQRRTLLPDVYPGELEEGHEVRRYEVRVVLPLVDLDGVEDQTPSDAARRQAVVDDDDRGSGFGHSDHLSQHAFANACRHLVEREGDAGGLEAEVLEG